MYLNKPVDWSDERYSKWQLPEHLNQAQQEAFWDDDEKSIPPLTEDELKELCLTVPCKVEVFRGNICHKAERKWPAFLYGEENKDFKKLTKEQQDCIYRKLEEEGVRKYNNCVDMKRVKRNCEKDKIIAMAPFWQARFFKHRYNRIMALADSPDSDENDESDYERSQSIQSYETVINTGNLKDQSNNNIDEDNFDPTGASLDIASEVEIGSRYAGMECSDFGSSSESGSENSTRESTEQSTEDRRPTFDVARAALVVESVIEINGFDEILTPDDEISESADKENNTSFLPGEKVLARVTKKLKTNAFAPKLSLTQSLNSEDFLSSNFVSSTQK